jgi:dihydroflavonol-4-reductase
MIDAPWDGHEPDPAEWPVLVTGAGGFAGGHIARLLAASGHRVRGLARRPPAIEPGDPPIEWVIGDIRHEEIRRTCVEGVRAVIHTAAWVSLGADRGDVSQAVNVDATRSLLEEAREAGATRFVYTSTLYTLGAGTRERPADESTPWNLRMLDSPYTRTKRAAEKLVLAASHNGFTTIALCPGMIQGQRDVKGTSTQIVRELAKAPVAVLPGGGIPIIDARVLALAHRRALVAGNAGERYAVVGPYLSYHDLAALVKSITGRPKLVAPLPDFLEPLVSTPVALAAPFLQRKWPDVSRPLVAGGFLRLYVTGARADKCFGLVHPPAVESIRMSL